MDYRPSFRATVRAELGDDGQPGRLHDEVMVRTVELGAVGNALARRLDGARTLEAIVAELAALDIPRGPVEETFRSFLTLNLVDGAGGDVVERVARLRRGDDKLNRIILEETRFACQGSGDCCQSYHFGPLTDEDIKLLESLPLADAFPHLRAPYWYERDLPGGGTGRFLTSVGDQCEFLLDDCRCGLHARFGFDKKPGLCRYYPYEQLATFDGIQTYDKGGCSQYAVSSRNGPRLSESIAWVAPLLPERPTLYHPIVVIDPSLPVDFGYLQPLLRASVDEVMARLGSAPESLRAVGRRLEALVQALRGCPFEPAAPTAATAAVLARPSRDFFAPELPAARHAGFAALARVAGALIGTVTEIIGQAHVESSEFYTARQSREVMEPLHLCASLAAHAADPAVQLSDYYREVAALPVDDPEVDEVLRLSLRQQLFGYGALIQDRVGPGLLRLAFVQLMALYCGRLLAARAGAARVRPTDLSQGHMLGMRVFGLSYNSKVFVEHADDVTAALEALPALAEWRP
jgi:hypothetical protein